MDMTGCGECLEFVMIKICIFVPEKCIPLYCIEHFFFLFCLKMHFVRRLQNSHARSRFKKEKLSENFHRGE